jgi:hypothetical protein
MSKPSEVLWQKQQEFWKTRDQYISRFSFWDPVFDLLKTGQSVAQVACGSITEDLYRTMAMIGDTGRIYLIDEDPAFIYNRARTIWGEEILNEQSKEFTNDEAMLYNLFASSNIFPYVQRLPPYPKDVKDDSLDHIMVIGSTFEMMATNPEGQEPDTVGFITDSYRKLRQPGRLLMHAVMDDDLRMFRDYMRHAGTVFIEDYSFLRQVEGGGPMGYWACWIKE